MSNNNYPGNRSPHPMYGIRPGFSIADLPKSYNSEVVVFTNITTPQVSTPINAGARYIVASASFTDPSTTCNIDLYDHTGTLISSVPVTPLAPTANFGNYEFINLQGLPFQLGISNIVNPHNLSLSYGVNG